MRRRAWSTDRMRSIQKRRSTSRSNARYITDEEEAPRCCRQREQTQVIQSGVGNDLFKSSWAYCYAAHFADDCKGVHEDAVQHPEQQSDAPCTARHRTEGGAERHWRRLQRRIPPKFCLFLCGPWFSSSWQVPQKVCLRCTNFLRCTKHTCPLGTTSAPLGFKRRKSLHACP